MSIQYKILDKKVLTSKESKKSAYSYYPFGMPMPNRQYSLSSSKYRFGFNTQEKDDEVYGAGNLMSAEYWEYDTRIGRRWNTDPIVKVWESPYAANYDNPIGFSDRLGLTGDNSGKDAENAHSKKEVKVQLSDEDRERVRVAREKRNGKMSIGGGLPNSVWEQGRQIERTFQYSSEKISRILGSFKAEVGGTYGMGAEFKFLKVFKANAELNAFEGALNTDGKLSGSMLSGSAGLGLANALEGGILVEGASIEFDKENEGPDGYLKKATFASISGKLKALKLIEYKGTGWVVQRKDGKFTTFSGEREFETKGVVQSSDIGISLKFIGKLGIGVDLEKLKSALEY